MKQTIIKVKSGTKFMTQIPEILIEYDNDLPRNAVIDKQVTGVGGTHIVLTNNHPYIVAVHLKRLIENKLGQEKYSHVLGVDGTTTLSDVQKYLASGGIKFLCTYDSVPKLQSFLGERSKEFNLLVDEVHCLIGYMDRFKPTVAINLINNTDGFNSTSYLTATPTNPLYLPEPLKILEQVKFEWEDAKKPDLVHAFSSRSLTEDCLSTIVHYLENTTDELYIFYNSRRYVVAMIKKLFKLNPNLNLDDINLLFSDTDENTAYFKKYLGSKFNYGSAPDGLNNKRINFISSMGFEGLDYLPNNDSSINPTTIIISDPRSKSMRFDIKVQLKQICGRFRANVVTGLMPINKIIYLWAGQEEDVILEEEDFLNFIKTCNRQSAEGLDQNRGNPMVMNALTFSAANHHGYWILDEKKQVMMHPYAVEAHMSNYHAMHSDAYVLDTGIDNSVVVSKLSDLSKDLNTFIVPLLPSHHKTKLGKIPSVQSLVSEYNYLIEGARSNPSFMSDLETFLSTNTTFSEWLDSGVTPQNMNTLKVKSKIESLSSNLRILAKVNEVNLPFKIDGVYAKTRVKDDIQKFYDNKGIKLKAKATDIKKWFEVKSTTCRVKGSCFRILSKL